ncbi:unnamed protein product, partial [Polarella glacialis]
QSSVSLASILPPGHVCAGPRGANALRLPTLDANGADSCLAMFLPHSTCCAASPLQINSGQPPLPRVAQQFGAAFWQLCGRLQVRVAAGSRQGNLMV